MTASRPGSLFNEIRALATGTWVLFRQEMSGKATLTRRQVILMAAGALTALTAILLVLAGFTLLLSQVLVSQAGWQPLTAGGTSALIIAAIFALTGWLVFRSGGARLKAESLRPQPNPPVHQIRRGCPHQSTSHPQPKPYSHEHQTSIPGRAPRNRRYR